MGNVRKHRFKNWLYFAVLPVAAGVVPGAGMCAESRAFPDLPEYVRLEDAGAAKAFQIRNRYHFSIREWIQIPLEDEMANQAVAAYKKSGYNSNTPRILHQSERGGTNWGWMEIALEPGEEAAFTVQPVAVPSNPTPVAAVKGHYASGLPAVFDTPAGRVPLFDLSIVEIPRSRISGTFVRNRDRHIREALEGDGRARINFRETVRRSSPEALELHYRGEGGVGNRYRLDVVYQVRSSGIVDTALTVTTLETIEKRGYFAIAKELAAVPGEDAWTRWKGERVPVAPGQSSPPRTVRSHAWGRDVSWLAIGSEEEGWNRAMFARFIPNLTRKIDGAIRNANDFFVNEYLVGTSDKWVLLSEISRENRELKSYIPRDLLIPAPGETLTLEHRLLPPAARSHDEIDDAFIGYAGYRAVHEEEPGTISIHFGVESASFGTSYFPHSTFGENFDHWRSAGLSGRFRPVDRFWPMFAHWQFFKDDIRRDFRIANALGLEWIRIHHFDAPDFRKDHLGSDEDEWMWEYLRFMVEAARETGLGIFLDFSLSPADAERVAEHFGDTIRYFEMQNEVLIIPGAHEDRFDYWREVRERIRRQRPDAPVFLTGGPQFYSLYEALLDEGVESDAVGQHAYVDRGEAAGYFRDIAVSLGGYATRTGRMPLNSEFNWRMITREAEEYQAAHFAEISRNLLTQQNIPLLLQFQFQETFTVPPRTRGALRHYELLRVDRSPKPQAGAYRDLIREFGAASNRLNQVEVTIEPFDLTPGAEIEYSVSVRNLTKETLGILAHAELSGALASFDGDDTSVFALEPGEVRVLNRRARVREDLMPGAYAIFERLEYNGEVHYGWVTARHAARPRLELDRPVLNGVTYHGGLSALADVDLSRFRYVVFGKDAPALEINWTYYLYQSLRSATGSELLRLDYERAEATALSSDLILVGTPDSNPLFSRLDTDVRDMIDTFSVNEGAIITLPNPVFEERTWLLVTGGDAEGVQRAASDFLYRYWRYAKDASSFREGMPPIEGEWESELSPVTERYTGDVTLRLPKTVGAGEAFRVVALDDNEPPGPAAGVEIEVVREGERVRVGRTSSFGEAVFQLDEPGDYVFRAGRATASAGRVTVLR